MLKLGKGLVTCYRFGIPIRPIECVGCRDNKCKEWQRKEDILKECGVTDTEMYAWIKSRKK